MTKEMFQAIVAYWKNPGGYTRERGMDLIAAGHLNVQEVERLEWALRQYRERVLKTT